MAKAKKETTNEPMEQVLWSTANKLRKNMDAAEYKHIVMGLIFLKYISDSFTELYNKLKEGKGEYEGANPEDINEYRAENVFYVPPQARWDYLQSRGKLPTIGKDVDDAMDALEKDNPSLKGVLPKEYAKEKLDKQSLGGLIDLVGTIVSELAMSASGTSGSHQRIRPEYILNIEMAKPKEKRITEFNDTFGEHINKIESNLRQIQTLEKLRDTLLPKLISGEIKVKENRT